jgi:hypothetical protein
MNRQVPVHNLGPNSKVDSPHEVMVVDCETLVVPGTDPVVQCLNLWSAAITRRHGKNPGRPRTEQMRGRTAKQLADWIETSVRGTPTMWLYFHNASFDLAVTRLPVLLMNRGWHLGAHALATDSPWAFMSQGRKSLRICDSFSILPKGIPELGELIQLPKLELPDQDAPDAQWWARCERDVQITMAALVQAMDWWDEHELGHWSSTGPQTGWNMMRHLCVKQPGGPPITQRGPRQGSWTQRGDGHVVVHPDAEARAWERAGLYQGRREAWRVGRLPVGNYAEIDFATAHLSVASDLKLPCRRGLAFERLDVDTPLLQHENVAVAADAVIATDTPRYPLRTKAGICYPVGVFQTRLMGPELVEARSRGELVAIGRGWYYRTSYHMQPWALYCRDVLDSDEGGVPAGARVMVKAFTTRVFGKWATRTSRLRYEGVSPTQGWSAVHATDSVTHDPVAVLHIAGVMQEWIRDTEGDDSFPAVLGWVQSYTRVALGRVIDAVGQDAMVSASTDSVIVDLDRVYASGRFPPLDDAARVHASGYAAHLAVQLGKACFPFAPRVKTVAGLLEVVTAQHLRVDRERRYSGVPRGASEPSHNQFQFRTWPKLRSQIAQGDLRGFAQPLRTVDLRAAAGNRWQAVDGCTSPPIAGWSEVTGTVLVGPDKPGCDLHGAAWGPHQWAGLPRL